MDLLDDERALEEIRLLASVFALVTTRRDPNTVELDEALGIHQQPHTAVRATRSAGAPARAERDC